MRWHVRLVVVGAALAIDFPIARADDGGTKAYVEGEVHLEERLLAPCCYAQTLDVHESEIATELRGEIRRRLQAGERADRIEDDLVERYGEKIRAVPKGSDPRDAVPWLGLVGLVAGGAVVGVLMRRWTRRKPERGRSKLPEETPVVDEYDARVDEELRTMDD